MLGSANLTELIIVEEERRPDLIGGYKKIWFSKYVTWAQFRPLFNKKQIGHEVAVSKQINSINYYEFSIRKRDDITNKMRIRYANKLFDIINMVEILPNKDFLEIIVKESKSKE
jgi:SPP1 family predicted phage head-tail adaptor